MLSWQVDCNGQQNVSLGCDRSCTNLGGRSVFSWLDIEKGSGSMQVDVGDLDERWSHWIVLHKKWIHISGNLEIWIPLTSIKSKLISFGTEEAGS